MHVIAASSGTTIPGADLHVPTADWFVFIALVVVLLLVDLLVLNREAHAVSMREAAISSAGWIGAGLLVGVAIWAQLGSDAATQYYTGYVIEKSLSVDNVFVWAVIMGYFSVPKHLQHRVLFWGIFGALVLRAIFIFAGIALMERFDFVLYIFGAFLVFTAWRIATREDEEIHPEKNPALQLVRRFMRVSADYDGQRFLVRRDGLVYATPLFVVLVMVEATDVVFAVDSIPAILAVSRSQFVVFASNAMAILGLRALYFLLAGAADRLVYLDKGLGVILAFVGVKMLIAEVYHVPTLASLGVITGVLAITVFLSLRQSRDGPGSEHSDPAGTDGLEGSLGGADSPGHMVGDEN